MANFKASFDLGLKAAEAAAVKMAEIDAVFDEMNSQISEACDGKIEIYKEKRYVNPIQNILGHGIFGGNNGSGKVETINYIIARNPLAEKNVKIDIGEIDISKNGYPCQIRVGAEKFICEDKTGLERVLSLMLADPEVGKELTKLINSPLQQDD
ncbi:hypothetical protein [Pseudomonas sp.]|jgi:hypothetical protein|uniref:hypothetical protein n=1 Tax=Pseudomonas sp. TaxID=306 RepID=UPI002ED90B71